MKANKYKAVDNISEEALPIARYAEQIDRTVSSVYVKHDRYKEQGKALGYEIVNFKGVNFVEPIKIPA